MAERQTVTIIFIIPLSAFLFLFFTLNGCNQDITDITKSTPDGDKRIIAANKVESAFSSLLALEKNPARVKALTLEHKDWLRLRRSHCAELMDEDVKKDNKKLSECYEAFDIQRIEALNNQRIGLMYDIPSQGTLPDNTTDLTYSQEYNTNRALPRSVVVSADAPIAAVEFNNNMTGIFDLARRRLINRIETFDAKISRPGVHFFLTPNGRILIGSFYVPRAKLMMWDVRTGELLRHKTLTQHNHLLTSQGRYFVYSDSFPDRYRIGIYDVIKGEATWNVAEGREWISLMAMSSDDKYLIAVRDHSIESWELVKAMDEAPSFVLRATEQVEGSNLKPLAIAFANDNKSFYATLPRGLIVKRRLPDLKGIRQLKFPNLSHAILTQIKHTDLLLMEAWFSDQNMEAFYVDMVAQTAKKIAEHTGANNRTAPLANGQMLLATPHELKTLKVPSKTGLDRFSNIIGEVISQDMPIKAPDKDRDKSIAPAQINCQNFQIEAIGVYEGSLADNRSRGGAEKIAGNVDIHISHTDLPVKLVLSSHEPVIWRLHISSDARLSEIYLSGSKDSRVGGAQSITIIHIGDAFAYEDSNVSTSRYPYIPSLADVVKQKIGCNITKFQGVYRGSNFYIGYITKDISGTKDKIYRQIDENGNVTYRNY